MNIRAGILSIISLFIFSGIEGQELIYGRKIVIEEVAATWCKFCPRGIVAMNTMKEKYPDSYIGIAIHGSGDPMWEERYAAGMDDYINTYPIIVVNRNRKMVGDPVESEKFYQEAISGNANSALSIIASQTDNNSNAVDVKIQGKFVNPVNGSAYRYAIVVTENNVTGSSPEYDQVNYYSGGTEIMGGFENLPDPVPASQMVYQDVARGIFPDFKGQVISNRSLSADEIFTIEYSFDLPNNILDKKNIEVIALLLDDKTGEIVNAAKTLVNNNATNTELYHKEDNIKVYASAGRLTVSTDKSDHIKVYSVTGALYTSKEVGQGTTILSLPKGFYIVVVGEKVFKRVIN